jgi:septal ring factor EnvC (AmiA/AmiB activator)
VENEPVVAGEPASVEGLQNLLVSAEQKVDTVIEELAARESELQDAQESLQTSQQRVADLQKNSRVERRKLQRTSATKERLKQQIKLLQAADKSSTAENAKRAVAFLQEADTDNKQLKNQLSVLLEKCAMEAEQSAAAQEKLTSQLQESRATVTRP